MFQTVLTFIGVIDAVMIAIILAGRIDVSSKLFWIAAVLLLPVVGPVFYFLYGDPVATR
ncbi:MAG TPA: PLD nuclease N-terminal domain-containing protein [Candidatus Sumerlaeota bacterium]|nr:PLDc_N domain-containing protein [Candidatus Sumerlaeota bacterium]HMX62641.1 PLD nuclease N-terminal domain-containing protein [Candidatus Sumerlaeota bacterium]HMZ51857.1 PLD nuclease N-terminal domain-containing protein [Candidatus Sumerlaeota bacterium]HNM46026.1 PLD nuclease N-terminal domain-containing protein [Candidatus Sumerlaeota bacterium]